MNTLITGASSGIGEALALACAKRGDRLFVCGRDRARMESVAERCRALGAVVEAEVLDVANAEATKRWVFACDTKAHLDRVFANAGVSTGEENEANVRRTFEINVGGTVNTVLPAIERKAGHIILTASIAGYGPLKSCPSYSATKSCIKTWGLSLRGMLAGRGIKVSVICPGFVRSRITDKNTCPMPFFMEADETHSRASRSQYGADSLSVADEAGDVVSRLAPLQAERADKPLFAEEGLAAGVKGRIRPGAKRA